MDRDTFYCVKAKDITYRKVLGPSWAVSVLVVESQTDDNKLVVDDSGKTVGSLVLQQLTAGDGKFLIEFNT